MSLSKPRWMKQRLPTTPQGKGVRRLLKQLRLNTVCSEANCPNRGECYADGTATFLIMGSVCTRNCRFCNIEGGWPQKLLSDEPNRVARAAAGMKLNHVVVTSVTRDDLPDGGANHFAKTIREIRELLPDATVEILIPDFQGDEKALEIVFVESPDVFNHNIETVPRLYPDVRPEADYRRSINVLKASKERELITKSGLMVGLGETREELSRTIEDLAAIDLDILTIGQYSAPSKNHAPVARYLSPEEFEELADEGEKAGLRKVVAGPLVRSSFRAGQVLNEIGEKSNINSA